jgi:threonine synthase
VSWRKSLRGIRAGDGTVERVTDAEILEAKAVVDGAGVGAEPASCATVAGIKKLVAAGVIRPDEFVCGILTGHVLKDADTVVGYHMNTLPGFTPLRANPPVSVPAALDALRKAILR